MMLPTGRTFTLAFLIGLAISIGVSYSNSFGIGFYFDDSYGITANPAIRSLRNIPSFFTDPFTLTTAREIVDVRPILVITYAFNYAISGLHPWSYHAFNILLYWIAAALVFIIVRDHLWWPASERGPEGAARIPAAAAALFFALAPLNSQALLYMYARSTLLCVTLYLGAFLALLRQRWTLGLILYSLSLLTKATAVTLPVVILAYDFIFRDRTRYPSMASYLSDWRRLLLPVLLPSILVATYLIYRAMSLPEWASQTRKEFWVTPWIWFISQWSALLYYVRLFLWPDALSVDHDFPYTTSLFAPRAWLSLLVLLTWITLVLRAAKRHPHVLFATAWFFITLAPESSFAPLAEVINDHRPYIAIALGLSVLLTWVLYRGAAMMPGSAGKIGFAVACVFLCIPAVVVNHYRSWQWGDSLRLWEDTAHKSPNNGRAWMNAGLEYMQRGNLTSARHYFERARQLTPAYAHVSMNMSVLEADEGHLDRALFEAQEAVRLAPGWALPHLYLGNLLNKIGRTADATVEYQRAVELEALYTRRDPNTAAVLFRRVLERNPTHYGATFQLAIALDRASKPSEARPLWERVLKMAEGYNDKQTADTARARLQQGQ